MESLQEKTTQTPDGTTLIEVDPWLSPYAEKLRERFDYYLSYRKPIDESGGVLGMISQGHEYFGFNPGTHEGRKGVWYREWAPGALQLRLIGDFNDWNRFTHPMIRDDFGVWSIFLSDEKYAGRLRHNSKIKVHVVAQDGKVRDRIPAYIKRVMQEDDKSFVGIYWNPQAFEWKHESPQTPRALRIYEAHVGMATEEAKVGTFAEFTKTILPRVKKLGYNAIQLMAIQEHPYYGSFGYHVSNFYAVSSRFGTPDDLKELIDAAHALGIFVIMDLVHSHSVKNTQEGLNEFDGTDYQYFHAGPRGLHSAWDSMCFDYSKYEVMRYLLSNVRYWLEEYQFDGFRFDGVTSMLYLNHGLGTAFGSYDDYFNDNVDRDAVVYLQLANEVAHATKSTSLTIAEDVSGMVGMGRPVTDGGLGFDYRLAMGVPDYWIKLLKEKADEDWNLSDLWHTLLNRRFSEKHVGYAESHDQALVGDKTLAFRLMDKEMYWNMAREKQSIVVDRGISLHKMIRLITFSLSGEGYLNFMGNEFGHPEWIDFPREGNNWSYHYARRQWSLSENSLLKYEGLQNFDIAMQGLDEKFNLLSDPFIQQLAVYEPEKLMIFRRGPLVFVFNFHPSESYTDLRIPVPDPKDYKVVLNTDSRKFDGPGLCIEDQVYWMQDVPMHAWKKSVQIYVPSRSAQVLAPL